MAFLSAASSSGTKPCVHHTSAVFAAALAIKGRASVPPAAKPRELRSTERRLRFPMSVSFPVLAPRGPFRGRVFVLTNLNRPRLAVGSTDLSASAYAPTPVETGAVSLRIISRVHAAGTCFGVRFFDAIGLLGHV